MYNVGVRQKDEGGEKYSFCTSYPAPFLALFFTRPNSPRFANRRWRLNTKINHHKPTKTTCIVASLASMKLNWNFQGGGGGVSNQKPMDIF